MSNDNTATASAMLDTLVKAATGLGFWQAAQIARAAASSRAAQGDEAGALALRAFADGIDPRRRKV